MIILDYIKHLILIVFWALVITAVYELVTAPVAKGSMLTVNTQRLVRVVGPVDATILKQAERMNVLSAAKQPIYVMVNTAGGSVATGSIFIDSIKSAQSKGIPVICFSSVVAASMGFSILMACDKVYVFNHTRLLFHPAGLRANSRLTAKVLEGFTEDLARIDSQIIEALKKKLTYTDEIEEAFYDEKMWTAQELMKHVEGKWMVLTKRINGVKNLYQYTAPSPFRSNQVPQIEIVNKPFKVK
jgi:ATP-dependent protease ClpP protease subunit